MNTQLFITERIALPLTTTVLFVSGCLASSWDLVWGNGLLLLTTEMTECLLTISQSIGKKASLFRRIYYFCGSSPTGLQMSLHMTGDWQTLTNITREQSQETHVRKYLQKQDPVVLEIHISCMFIFCSVWAIVSCPLWCCLFIFQCKQAGSSFAFKYFVSKCFFLLVCLFRCHPDVCTLENTSFSAWNAILLAWRFYNTIFISVHYISHFYLKKVFASSWIS